MSFSVNRFLSLARPRSGVSLSSTNATSQRSIHISLPRRSPGSAQPSGGSTASHASHQAHPHAHGHGQHPHPPPRNGGKKSSPHMVWYREIVPAMVPIFLISTTLFLSLSLVRTHLSHSRSLSESTSRIEELEAQLSQLRVEQKRARIREKKERERLLPIVVERVLQRVGVVGGEEEEEEEVEEKKELPRLL